MNLIIVILVVAGTCIFSENQVYAKNTDTKEQAVQAYRHMLAQKKIQFHEVDEKIRSSQCKYALVYVDDDNIPELVIDARNADHVSHASGWFNLYTFTNGEIKYICNTSDGFRYVKKSGVFLGNYSGMGIFDDWYCLMKGKAYQEFAAKRADYGMQDPYDDNAKPKVTYFNGKKVVSKKRFERLVHKQIQGKKIITPDFQKNTYCLASTKKDTVSIEMNSAALYRDKVKLLEKKYGVFQVEG